MSPAKIAAGMVRSEATGAVSLEKVAWLVTLIVAPLTVWLGTVGLDLSEETVSELLAAAGAAIVSGVIALAKYRERRRQDRLEVRAARVDLRKLKNTAPQNRVT